MTKLSVPVLAIPNVVFFPHASLPIYIVDPIYVRMVRECVSNDQLMAITMMSVNGSPFSSVQQHFQVCSVGKPIILEEMSDGGIKALIKGVERVKLLTPQQHLPYLICNAEVYYDQLESEVVIGSSVERLKKILNDWLVENIPSSVERQVFTQSLISVYHVVDYVSMFLIQDTEIRQLLLENTSIYERIQMLNSLLKESKPFSEDPTVVSAIKNFETLESSAKFGH